MKTLFIVLCLLNITSWAQDLPDLDKEGKVVYIETVNIQAADSIELLERGRYYFKHSEGLQSITVRNNRIASRGKSDFYGGKKKMRFKMTYILSVEVKASRYRIIMKNIVFTPYPTPYDPQPFSTSAEDLLRSYKSNKNQRDAARQYEFLESAQNAFNNRVNEIKDAMLKAIPQTKEDW